MNRNKLHSAVAAAAIWVVSGAFTVAVAGEPDLPTQEPTGSIDLHAALSLAMSGNPSLAASAQNVLSIGALEYQASLRLNPELSVEMENFGGTGDLNGFDRSETTLSLAYLFESGGKRSKRIHLAGRNHKAAVWEHEVRIQEIQTITKTAFLHLLASQQRLSLVEDLIRITDESFGTVEKLVAAGAVSPLEKTRAGVEFSSSRLRKRSLLRRLEADRFALAACWGSEEAHFSRVKGDIERTIEPPPLEKLRNRIDTTPDLARWPSEIERLEAELELQRSLGSIDLMIEGGWRRETETGDGAIVVSAGVPLPIFDRNQGGILAAKHEVAKGMEMRRQSRMRVVNSLHRAYEDLLAAFEETRTLKEEIIPEAERGLDSARDAHARGLYSLTDILEVQRTLFGLRAEYLDALVRYHEAVIEIEHMIGESMDAADQEWERK